MTRKFLVLTLSSLIPAAVSYGAWEVIDDFDSYADQAALQAVWTQDNDPDGSGGGGVLLEDPTEAGNMLLQVNQGATTAETGTYNVRLYRAIPNIEPGSGLTTVYWRFMVPNVMDGNVEVPGVVDQVWGLSPVDDATGYADYSPLARQEFDGSLDIYDTTTYNLIFDILPGGVWYEMWWVVDATNRSFSVYIQGGDTYPTQTLVAENYGWRNQTLEAIDRFLLTSSAGTLLIPKGLDAMLIDDLYMSAGQELTSPNAAPPSDAEFDNISTRGVVGTGPDRLIAGFVVRGVPGSATGTVMVRAVGPGLTAVGVNSGFLEDPIMDIFQNGAIVYSNDNWGDNANAAEIKSVSETIGAFALADGSKDAVLMLSLPPGVYTARVGGVGGGTGIAIIEVYAVD